MRASPADPDGSRAASRENPGTSPAGNADLPMMIEVAAQAAWSTDRGQPIAAAVVSALRAANIILPAGSVIECAAIAGRARARRRATDALLAGVSDEQTAKLDRLLVRDAAVDMTPFAWLKAMPVAPKADHVRELLDRLRRVRDLGLPADIAARIDEQRLRHALHRHRRRVRPCVYSLRHAGLPVLPAAARLPRSQFACIEPAAVYKICSRSSGGGSGRTSSASTGTRFCVWSRR